MITYEQKDITIAAKDGPMTITAQVASNGLAYHPTLVKPDEQDSSYLAHRWTVTHVATGRCICDDAYTFHDDEQCQRFIEKIGDLYNWHLKALKPPTKKVQRHIKKSIRESKYGVTYL